MIEIRSVRARETETDKKMHRKRDREAEGFERENSYLDEINLELEEV